MSKPATEGNLESRAQFFKALAHPSRLLILSLIQMQPRHGEELAAILRLKPATISHHLALLTEVGLLQSEKDQYYHTYSLVKARLDKPLGEMIFLPQSELDGDVEANAYRQKVLKTFFRRGRLTQIPAQLKKRLIILEQLLQGFEPEREYTEREVNQILLEFHDDVATLRRELVGNGFMQREQGIYRRVDSTPEEKGKA